MLSKKGPLRYGCHIRSHGSFTQMGNTAIRLAELEGCSCFQFFAKNPRSLQLKIGYEHDAHECRLLLDGASIQTIIHSAYVLNIATSMQADDTLFKAHAMSLLNDLVIADACGAVGVVVHFGVIKHRDKLQGYRDIITMLNVVTDSWHGNALILLENQAGLHGGLGVTLEECVHIRNLCRKPDQIGFCLDTCHAYVSGMWNANLPDGTARLLEHGRHMDYWPYVAAVHVNDAQAAYGSKRDRHAPIGQGKISPTAMEQLLTSTELQGKMFILETPESGERLHSEEWELIRTWYALNDHTSHHY
ncbi:deoxyribonuclease IV [Paenibacillus taiwanensis]|uniref:deoxyribonuclease IV n=1 Tax=Paenibacillus taiwanensis TaxID=401638 RepID=UPI0003FEDE2B|nr:deoxyribonuclease IV [Paenibacillus taiwanensis]